MDSEGGCDENLEADSCASNYRRVTFSPQIRFLNSDHGGGFRPDSETNQELRSPDSSDTESSSLSNSSFDDFIQINTQILLKSSGESDISQPTVSTEPSNVKEKCILTSEALDDTHESVRDYLLPTLSPSVQMMERPEDFDCHGIGASNDSVFRIHITNKRKDTLRTDVDLYKLEDRPKTVELCQSGLVPERKLNTAKAIGEDVKYREKGLVDESINYVSKSPMSNTMVGDSRDSSSAKCQSVKKKYPCHYPDCGLAFHCFKWPSCCSSKWIGWPGCSLNCSWRGCCCKWPSYYYKCPILSSCCVKHNY